MNIAQLPILPVAAVCIGLITWAVERSDRQECAIEDARVEAVMLLPRPTDLMLKFVIILETDQWFFQAHFS